MDLIKTPHLKYNKNKNKNKIKIKNNNFHFLLNNKTTPNLSQKQLKFQLNKILSQKIHLYCYFIQRVGQELLLQLFLHLKYLRILCFWLLHYLQ